MAVQAQDYTGAKWAIGQRVAGSTDAALDRLVDDGALVRLHVLRPTWHLVAAADIRWLLALTAPRVHRGNTTWYRTQGIDDETRRVTRRVLVRELGGRRSRTRDELGVALTEAGLSAVGPRLAALVMQAELDGLICSGPRRGRRQTYALLDERVPPTAERGRDEALAELAGRYVAGHGPAQAIDLAWWSGLTIRDARRGLELASPALDRELVGERELWAAPGQEPGHEPGPGALPGPSVRLLPNYDELFVAFRDRRDALDPGLPPDRATPFTVLGHSIVRDGLLVGTWRRTEGGPVVVVEADVLVPFHEVERAGLERAAAALASFLERAVELRGD